MLEFDWYSYQCFWCWFGSARTWSLLLTQSAQITLDWCMHLLISLSTWSIYIRRHRSQFLWCEDQKTGWCTKAHANFFADDNNQLIVLIPTICAPLLISPWWTLKFTPLGAHVCHIKALIFPNSSDWSRLHNAMKGWIAIAVKMQCRQSLYYMPHHGLSKCIQRRRCSAECWGKWGSNQEMNWESWLGYWRCQKRAGVYWRWLESCGNWRKNRRYYWRWLG